MGYRSIIAILLLMVALPVSAQNQVCEQVLIDPHWQTFNPANNDGVWKTTPPDASANIFYQSIIDGNEDALFFNSDATLYQDVLEAGQIYRATVRLYSISGGILNMGASSDGSSFVAWDTVDMGDNEWRTYTVFSDRTGDSRTDFTLIPEAGNWFLGDVWLTLDCSIHPDVAFLQLIGIIREPLIGVVAMFTAFIAIAFIIIKLAGILE